MSESLFLSACRKEPVARTPVWMMRQAGRYLPEYQQIRAKADFLTICRTPELAAEVTLQPVRRFGFDAAIIFSDILIPLEALGFPIAFVNDRPTIAQPVGSASDVPEAIAGDFEASLQFVYQAIGLVCSELPSHVPLIGFAGAPFTLGSYLIEGGGSRTYAKTKTFLYECPEAAHRLLGLLADAVAVHLQAQIRAGAQAVQLFDSWAGALAEDEYRVWALPYVRRIMDALRSTGVPRILFTLYGAHLTDSLIETGADVLSIDWHVPMDRAFDRLSPHVAIQGNLDPTRLLGGCNRATQEVTKILDMVNGRPGHIMNLGHGVLPSTPVENVEALVCAVHAHRRALDSSTGSQRSDEESCHVGIV